jgi:hypothetical protein
VTSVTFPVTEPKSNYPYTLVAVPEAASSALSTGNPISSGADTGCGFATPETGTYASTLCLVDFSVLTGNNMLAATTSGGCTTAPGLDMSVTLPQNYQLYFCLNISGPQMIPSQLPTWPGAFLGNSITGSPFYTGIPGEAALYQNVQGATDTVTINNIIVDSPQGIPATGWEAVTADAESTDAGESITWTSDSNLYLLDNTPTSPMGSACETGAQLTPQSELTGGGSKTVTCTGYTYKDSQGNQLVKTGTAMLWALTPNSLVTTLNGTGLEAMSFGLLLS